MQDLKSMPSTAEHRMAKLEAKYREIIGTIPLSTPLRQFNTWAQSVALTLATAHESQINRALWPWMPRPMLPTEGAKVLRGKKR